MMKRFVFLLVVLAASGAVRAELSGVLHWESGHDLEIVYDSVYKSLEENRFFVVFEPDIGRNLAGFAERWGEDYNRNDLQGIRAMVFCNGWYANQVSNLEPRLLALCPLHLSVYRQGDSTHVVFVRPGLVGKNSKAEALLQELEADVSKAVEQGLSAAQP
jgi:uncharacterized protein (DUF302 family)